MSKKYVTWYGKCVESLFLGHKDSWVCRKVVELSVGVEKEAKEEIIKDTKFRFRALLDYVKRVNRSFLMKAWMKHWLILSRWICMNI